MGQGRIRGRRVLVSSVLTLAVVALAGSRADAGSAPVFNAGQSFVRVIHDSNASNTTVPPAVALSLQGSTPAITFSATSPLGGGAAGDQTTARAGAGHLENIFRATSVFASGTGISQTDAAPSQPFSQLTVDFRFVWDIVGSGFGPPTSGAFSIPVAGTVGVNGRATFGVNVAWDAIINGAQQNNVRAPYNDGATFTNSGTSAASFFRTFTAPSAVFTPSTLLNTAGTDRFILRGQMRLTADNQDEETSIALDGDGFGGIAVPLPPAAWAGLGMLGALAAGEVVRRRRYARQ